MRGEVKNANEQLSQKNAIPFRNMTFSDMRQYEDSSRPEIRYRDPAIRVPDRIYGITDNG